MRKLKEKIPAAELFNLYSDDVLRYALSILKNLEEARDIRQEVFLKFLESADSYEERCNQKTWLFTITRNQCYNLLKRASGKNTGLEKIILLHRDNENINDIITMRDALSKLSAEESEMVYLKDFERYSYREMAVILDISVDNVKVKLFRTKQKLRKLIGEK